MAMEGLIDGRSPITGPTKFLVDTEAEARAAVDEYARLGFTGIKIYNSIKPELVPKIVELARAKGMRVSGHVPNGMTAEDFVRAGADEIHHLHFLFVKLTRDTKYDAKYGAIMAERRAVPYAVVADRFAAVAADRERVEPLIQLLKNRKIIVDPTVTILENLLTSRPGVIADSYKAIADRLPLNVRRNFLRGGVPFLDASGERSRESFRAMLRTIKDLYDAGVPLVAGTDALAGFTLHRELELYVEAGIPAAEVLRIATIKAARLMKRDGELGSIAPGKLADLILVHGNPAQNISDIRRVSLVVKDGNIYETRALYKAIGVRQ